MRRRASSTRTTISPCGSARTCGRSSARSRASAITPRTRRSGWPPRTRRPRKTRRRPSPNCATRIHATLDMLKSIDAKAMEGGETREIVIPAGANKLKLPGADYLLHFAMPNFYFHLTTAYDILRGSGVEIGKRSFMGAVPNLVRLSRLRSIDHDHHQIARRPAHVAGRHPRLDRLSRRPGRRSGERQERRRSDQGDPRDDRPPARRSGIGQDQDSFDHHLSRRHRHVRRNERSLGRVGPAGHAPARATVEAKLAAPPYTVEIACIAATGTAAGGSL